MDKHVYFIYSKKSIIIILISTLIGLSRIYLKVHYVSDVVFGALLGLFCGNLTASLLNVII